MYIQTQLEKKSLFSNIVLPGIYHFNWKSESTHEDGAAARICACDPRRYVHSAGGHHAGGL